MPNSTPTVDPWIWFIIILFPVYSSEIKSSSNDYSSKHGKRSQISNKLTDGVPYGMLKTHSTNGDSFTDIAAVTG